MDIVYLVLGNIIAGALVQAATTGAERVWLFIVMGAVDVAFVYKKFKG
jgi:hypothetical protein